MKRERFGQRSERSQRLIDQLELSFEEAEAEAGAARATVPCFCAALRSLSTRSSRSRSGGETSNLILVRIALNRMILALLRHILIDRVCKRQLTVWASSGWRSCEPVENGLSDRGHAGLWRRSPNSFFPSRCPEAAGLEEGVGDHRHQGMSV